jgi:hypothetical protein
MWLIKSFHRDPRYLLQAASVAADTVVHALHSIASVMGCSDQFHTTTPQRQKSFSESEAWEDGLKNHQVLSISNLSRLK